MNKMENNNFLNGLTDDETEMILNSFEDFKTFVEHSKFDIPVSFEYYEFLKSKFYLYKDSKCLIGNDKKLSGFNKELFTNICKLLFGNGFNFFATDFEEFYEYIIFCNRPLKGDCVIIKNNIILKNDLSLEVKFNDDEKDSKVFENINETKLLKELHIFIDKLNKLPLNN